MDSKSKMIEALVKKNMAKSQSEIPCIFGGTRLCLHGCIIFAAPPE